MNSRSCEVMMSAPSKSRRNCSSQRIDSMSRWLVGSSSKQRVGVHQQDAGERHAHLPAAGELADVVVDRLGREAEAGQDLARLRLEGVAAELVEARLHLAEALDQLLELVGARRDRPWRARARAARARPSATSPAPAIVSSTTVRPRISPDVLAEVADASRRDRPPRCRRRAALRARSGGRWCSCRSRWARRGRPSRRGTGSSRRRGRGSAGRAAWRPSRAGSSAAQHAGACGPLQAPWPLSGHAAPRFVR